MKTHFISMLATLLFITQVASSKPVELKSPSGNIKVRINLSDRISYSVLYNNDLLLDQCHLKMSLDQATLGENPQVISKKYSKLNETIKPVTPVKFSKVQNQCNVLKLQFKGNYALEFRAYDDGVAYRFITKLKGDIVVKNEEFTIGFPEDYLSHLQLTKGYKTSYENSYSQFLSSEWHQDKGMSTLPVLIETKKKYKIYVCETDLNDYPGLFLNGTGGRSVYGSFPKVPLSFEEGDAYGVKITSEADYIAKTKGTRTFPWRYFILSKQDGEIVESTLPMKLAAPSEIKDPSWIHPGQVTWEWWNAACPYGPDVNFVAGCNTETYKYYIDFAAKFGINYLLMDEGWAKMNLDPFTTNPQVDLHELISYASAKDVKIILWLTWVTVQNHMDLFKTFKDWGVAGVKIDFMDRSDQWMVNFYERVAQEAAKEHIFVDFHGSFKPAGLEYRYPNVLSYEGVRGMEQMGGATPDNSLYLPFMRNVAGYMDYTPGAMLSMQPESYASRRPNSASIGTRVYQMALYVVFESPLQMLADNPTLYYNNLECTEFITQIPTTWDETKALYAEAGQVLVLAKRKGEDWYIAAITNNNKREIKINLDFLTEGKEFTMTCFKDGVNADRQAMDYRKEFSSVHAADSISIHLVRNGGWLAKIESR